MSEEKICLENLTPKQIVAKLDTYIVGQQKAKKAVAIALRNRTRRLRLPEDVRDEVAPKNILMIGPTGVGKTEIARRLAKLCGAPFLKVEATKYLLIWTGGSTPLLCLEGVPDFPVAPRDEAGLTKTFQTWPRGWFHIP